MWQDESKGKKEESEAWIGFVYLLCLCDSRFHLATLLILLNSFIIASINTDKINTIAIGHKKVVDKQSDCLQKERR